MANGEDVLVGNLTLESFIDRLATAVANKIQIPAQAIPAQLQGLLTQNVPDFFYMTFPADGTKVTVGPGITQFDFIEGKVYLPDGTEQHLSDTLLNHHDQFMRSFQIDVDQAVIIWLDNGGKKPVDFLDIHGENYVNFQNLYIQTAVTTKFDVWASNNPDAYLRKFKPIIYQANINQYGQLVYPNADVGNPLIDLKYLATANGSYVPVNNITVGTFNYGVLIDVSFTSDPNALYKLMIGTHVHFRDVPLLSPVSIPFLPHFLPQQTNVRLDVRSTSGTVEVNGLIAWKEVLIPTA